MSRAVRQGGTGGGRARLRCLERTRIAAGIGKRVIAAEELVGVFDGPMFQDAVWDALKREGLVANGRGIAVRLTPKGERELAQLRTRYGR